MLQSTRAPIASMATPSILLLVIGAFSFSYITSSARNATEQAIREQQVELIFAQSFWTSGSELRFALRFELDFSALGGCLIFYHR